MKVFDICFMPKPTMLIHSTCCRCQQPTEMSPQGSGRVPLGKGGELIDVHGVVVCIDCLKLLAEQPKSFWWSGWPYQQKNK